MSYSTYAGVGVSPGTQITHKTVTFKSSSARVPGQGLPIIDRSSDPQAEPTRFGDLVVNFDIYFPQVITARQKQVLQEMFGGDSAEVLEGIARLLTVQQRDVPLGEDEARFCTQCWHDQTGTYQWCMPQPRFFTWWTATIPPPQDPPLTSTFDFEADEAEQEHHENSTAKGSSEEKSKAAGRV